MNLKSIPIVVLLLASFGLAAVAQTPSLALKAEVFEHDLNERFRKDGQLMCKLRLPSSDRNFISYNMPDNAYMTGIHCGTLALKYAMTGDEAAKQEVYDTVRALELLCTVSGEPGLLARAAVPVDAPFHDDGIWRTSPDGRYRWRGDVSSDQMTGVFYGFALAHAFAADSEVKAIIAERAEALADHLLQNELRIVGFDGELTQWGRYYPEYVRTREPMNALLFLQHMKVAWRMTGEPRFKEAYHHYAENEGYAHIAVKARRLADPRRVNHSDDVLIYLAYVPLLMFEDDPELSETYRDSLRRAWDGNDRYPGTKPEMNPYYAFVAGMYLDDESGVKAGKNTLQWFPFQMKWNHETIRRYKERFAFNLSEYPLSPAPAEGEVIPIDRRPDGWSAWVQNPYVAGDSSEDQSVVYNGHDYLMGYWMGRWTGYIDPGE